MLHHFQGSEAIGMEMTAVNDKQVFEDTLTLREKGWARWILTLPPGVLQRSDHSNRSTELKPTYEDITHTFIGLLYAATQE